MTREEELAAILNAVVPAYPVRAPGDPPPYAVYGSSPSELEPFAMAFDGDLPIASFRIALFESDYVSLINLSYEVVAAFDRVGWETMQEDTEFDDALSFYVMVIYAVPLI